MCVRHCGLAWTLMLLLVLPGGLCSEWSVVYPETEVCAVRNSTAVFQCSFRYPDDLKVETVKWAHGRSRFTDGPFFYDSKNKSSSSRFEYIGDKTGNCSLKIHQVEQKDAGKYAFRFTTNVETGKFTGVKGLTLRITDLQVVLTTKPRGDGTVKEGDSLSLTSKNRCDGARASSSFTWFKNGRRVKEGPVYNLTNVSSRDSGNYTCSLSAHTGTTSGVLSINVEYGPKNTWVEVEVDVGSNITLTCSSQANPSVQSYVWFEVREDHVVEVGQGPVLVTDVEGQFLCSASNKHGSQNSSVVPLKIKYKESNGPKNTSVEVYVGTKIILTCSSQADPPVESYVWFEVREDHVVEVKRGPVLVTDVEGQFLCSASNKHGSQNSSVVMVKTKGQLDTFIKQVIIINIVVILLIVIIFSAVIRFKIRRHQRAPESQEDIQDTEYANWHDVSDNDQPREENEHDGGPVELVYANVDFSSAKKSEKKQRRRDGDDGDDGDVVYSTVCK